MSELYLVPVGEIHDDSAATAADCVAGVFGLRGVFLNPVPVPKGALDPKRAQYSSPVLLEAVIRSLPRDRTRALALTSCDIFIPMLTFLFGQAQLGGRVALVSTARLQPQFYGLPPNPELVAERLRKEIIHEVGHTLGLVHCPDRSCAMSLANSIWQVDVKEDAFCRGCRGVVDERLSQDRLEGVS